MVHLTQIVDDEMTNVHLCEQCAAEKGLESDCPSPSFPLTDFLAQLGEGSTESATEVPAACSFCGLSLKEFRERGRLGCPHCWATFESHLRNLLRRVHGGTQHVGKVYLPPDPSSGALQQRLTGLRRKLDRAVHQEDFERAAELRDEIRTLEPTPA